MISQCRNIGIVAHWFGSDADVFLIREVPHGPGQLQLAGVLMWVAGDHLLVPLAEDPYPAEEVESRIKPVALLG